MAKQILGLSILLPSEGSTHRSLENIISQDREIRNKFVNLIIGEDYIHY